VGEGINIHAPLNALQERCRLLAGALEDHPTRKTLQSGRFQRGLLVFLDVA
jgi:hypothetical protein